MSSSSDIHLGDVFDPEDRIDRFVFLLSETLADLGAMESQMKGNLFTSGTSVARSLYLQRHLAARVVDSWRAIAAIRDHQEIRNFVDEAGAGQEADWLLEKLTKKPGDSQKTPVENIFQLERHRTVHLACVDDDKLRETMKASAPEVMQIGIFHRDQKMVIEFPEAAIARAIFGPPDDPQRGERELEKRAEFLEELLRKFGALWGKSLTLHLSRHGISDPTRLHIVRQETGTWRHRLALLLRGAARWLESASGT